MSEKNAWNARSGMGTLTMLGVLVTALLVTGIGQYVWRQGGQIGAHCRDIMLDLNFQAGLDTCQTIGLYVVSFQRQMEQSVGQSHWGDTMNFEEFAGHLARQFSNATLNGYNAPSLSGLVNPNLLRNSANFDFANASSLDKLSMAITQGMQGNQLMRSGRNVQGLNFLQSSASMGDVGVLSQLQLGSAFATGTNGIAADAGRSRQYYGQALNSINSLEAADSPSSQRLLNALPAPPAQLKSQLQHILRETN